VIVSSAATLYCLPPVLMTANIVLSRVPPEPTHKTCAAGFFAADRNAALTNRGLVPGLEAYAQNQKRGLAAAL
jgi:hypothetical protein